MSKHEQTRDAIYVCVVVMMCCVQHTLLQVMMGDTTDDTRAFPSTHSPTRYAMESHGRSLWDDLYDSGHKKSPTTLKKFLFAR